MLAVSPLHATPHPKTRSDSANPPPLGPPVTCPHTHLVLREAEQLSRAVGGPRQRRPLLFLGGGGGGGRRGAADGARRRLRLDLLRAGGAARSGRVRGWGGHGVFFVRAFASYECRGGGGQAMMMGVMSGRRRAPRKSHSFLYLSPTPPPPDTHTPAWTPSCGRRRSMTPSTGPPTRVRGREAGGRGRGKKKKKKKTANHSALSLAAAATAHTPHPPPPTRPSPRRPGAPVWNNNNSLTVGPRGALVFRFPARGIKDAAHPPPFASATHTWPRRPAPHASCAAPPRDPWDRQPRAWRWPGAVGARRGRG